MTAASAQLSHGDPLRYFFGGQGVRLPHQEPHGLSW
jgi:hypothetical protein